MNRTLAASVSCLTALASLSLPQAEAADPGFYVGGYYGSLSHDANEDQQLAVFAASAAADYFSVGLQPLDINASRSEKDHSYGLVGGFRWTPNFALELQYAALGKIKFRTDNDVAIIDPPGGQGAASVRYSFDSSALTLSALGIWPLTYQWELFGRAGLSITNTHARYRLSAFGVEFGAADDKDDLDWSAGAGISYTFLDVYTLRGEFTRIFEAGHKDLGPEDDLDLMSLSILIHF